VNKFRPKDANYDLLFNPNMVAFEKLIEANHRLIAKFKALTDDEALYPSVEEKPDERLKDEI
jgi:hypothetical protein